MERPGKTKGTAGNQVGAKSPVSSSSPQEPSRTGFEKYHVALSFAGEDRCYVDAVAAKLRDAGVKVFYD